MKQLWAVFGMNALFTLALAVCPAWTQTAKLQPVSASPAPAAASQRPRDIVFIIMDDVGIDEMTVFGWGKGRYIRETGETLPPPKLPNIDAIALSGVMFGNTWVMPECSPSRAGFFTGRYPMRTGVTSALIDNMLPSSQVSPYETTIPRVLAGAGYSSALIGKFHLGVANPLGSCSPAALGWNYFNGYNGASPGAIDTTAGDGKYGEETGPFACGFDQSGSEGACYQSEFVCHAASNGKTCLDSGGLFRAGAECVTPAPPELGLDFGRANSYFVWPNVVSLGPVPQDEGPGRCAVQPVISRIHQTPAQGDSAVKWWMEQKGPRMLTLAYSIEHTPFQQPVGSPADVNTLKCQALTQGEEQPRIDQWKIANAMMSNMDADIGRVLQGLGLVTLDSNGVIQTVTDKFGHRHIPQLEKSGVMVVIVGDNGQFATLVEDDFNPARSKGTIYQTGVWVPLIVAGSLVQGATGRMDNHMINGVDLFQLFGEIAGLDVNQVVSPAHSLDSKPMLIHLTDPHHGETRTLNFTELGPGTFELPTNNETRSWPCVLGGMITQKDGVNTNIDGGTCVDVLFNNRAFCEQENSGVWFGPPDDTDARPLQFPNRDMHAYKESWSSCCAVMALNSKLNPRSTALVPVNQWAERDSTHKYVELEIADCRKPVCTDPSQPCYEFPPFERTKVTEFYDITPTVTNPAGLDNGPLNFACPPGDGKNPIDCVPEALHPEFKSLQSALHAQLDSEVACAGDGNLDKRVNQFDLAGVLQFLGSGPSVWDFDDSATTDEHDVLTVVQNLGTDCIGLCRRADLNRDGVVNAEDLKILEANLGKPCELCGSDLNGDGKVNFLDVKLMKEAIGACAAPVNSAVVSLPKVPRK